MTTMSASPSNRIQCYRCGHVFDHDPKLSKHCTCFACGVSISIPDARRSYCFFARAEVASDGLPPPARDNDGQPLPKPKPEIQPAEKPRFAADDFAEIARRLKARQAAEAAARSVAREDD